MQGSILVLFFYLRIYVLWCYLSYLGNLSSRFIDRWYNFVMLSIFVKFPALNVAPCTCDARRPQDRSCDCLLLNSRLQRTMVLAFGYYVRKFEPLWGREWCKFPHVKAALNEDKSWPVIDVCDWSNEHLINSHRSLKQFKVDESGWDFAVKRKRELQLSHQPINSHLC